MFIFVCKDLCGCSLLAFLWIYEVLAVELTFFCSTLVRALWNIWFFISMIIYSSVCLSLLIGCFVCFRRGGYGRAKGVVFLRDYFLWRCFVGDILVCLFVFWSILLLFLCFRRNSSNAKPRIWKVRLGFLLPRFVTVSCV